MIVCERCGQECPSRYARLCGPCYGRLRYERALATPKVCGRCGGEYRSLRTASCDRCRYREATTGRPVRGAVEVDRRLAGSPAGDVAAAGDLGVVLGAVPDDGPR